MRRKEWVDILVKLGVVMGLVLERYLEGMGLLFSKISFEVGNGRRVKLWIDKWCGEEPFCMSFPSLFALALSKKAWLADFGMTQEEWDIVPCAS